MAEEKKEEGYTLPVAQFIEDVEKFLEGKEVPP